MALALANIPQQWTTESRLEHLGYDFDPLVRTIIGLQGRLNLLRALLARGEKPSTAKIKGTRIYYGDEVQYLDRAIADALRDREENESREKIRKYFEHWGKKGKKPLLP